MPGLLHGIYISREEVRVAVVERKPTCITPLLINGIRNLHQPSQYSVAPVDLQYCLQLDYPR